MGFLLFCLSHVSLWVRTTVLYRKSKDFFVVSWLLVIKFLLYCIFYKEKTKIDKDRQDFVFSL
jgi:hypothetical protein